MIYRILLRRFICLAKCTNNIDSFKKEKFCFKHERLSILYLRKLKYCQMSSDQEELQNSGHLKTDKREEEILMKFRKNFDKMTPPRDKTFDRYHKTNFGTIRFDDENFPTEYLEKDNNENDIFLKNRTASNNVEENYFELPAVNISDKSIDNISICDQSNELNYIDAQYLHNGTSSYLENENSSANTQFSNKSISKKDILDVNSVDEQYFTDNLAPLDAQYSYNSSLFKNKDTSTSTQYGNKSVSKIDILDVNSVDEQYFTNNLPPADASILDNMNMNYVSENISLNLEDIVNKQSSFNNNKFTFAEAIEEDLELPVQISNLYRPNNNTNINLVKDRLSLEDDLLTLSESLINNKSNKQKSLPKKKFIESVISEDENTELESNHSKEKISSNNPSFNSNTSQNAYEYVMKKRKDENKGKEVDENQPFYKFQKIKHEVPVFKDFLKNDFVEMLKSNVIYDDNEILAIYKHYGIPFHGGTEDKYGKLCRFNIVDSLELLAKRLKKDKIFPVHRLDANTTGVLLFAKTAEMADNLKKLFHDQKIKKSYLAITKGIPSPLSGVINIPIAEGRLENHIRMVLRPDIPGFRHKAGLSKQAITHFKVISHANNSALMMLNPISGIKHQIRVHLGFGIDCPVLGDHKYSHLKKMIPQKLPGDMLDHLQVKQTRVRDLPMFLHAFSVSIPYILECRDLVIRAGPPKFFKTAMRALELNKTQNHIGEVPELIFNEKQVH